MREEGPLARLSDYELRHLTGHLIASGRVADLHRLLGLERPDGRNAWFEAKTAGGGTGEYAADVAVAWRSATAAGDVPRQVRYALMTASVRSRWQHLPARLLASAVAAGLVSWVEALSIVEQVPGEVARANALEELAPVLPERGLAMLLDRTLSDDLLGTVAPYLSLELVRRAVPAARRQVRTFQDTAAIHELIYRLVRLGQVDEALDLFAEHPAAALVPRLAPMLDDRGRARLVADPDVLVRVLATGGGDLVEPELLGAWAERVLAGPVPPDTAKALVAAYPRLPASVRERIDPLLLCAAVGDREQEVRALVALAGPCGTVVLDQAVARAMSAPVTAQHPAFPELRDEPERGRLCLLVAPAVAEHGDRQVAIDLATVAFDAGLRQRTFTTYGGEWLGNALIRLADGDALDDAVRRVIATRDPWPRVNQLLTIMPLVAERHRPPLLRAVRAVIALKDMSYQRANLLVDVLPWLPAEEREDALGAALAADPRLPLRTNGSPRREVLVLPELAGMLPTDARARFAARVAAAADRMAPDDAATTLLTVARMSPPDRRATSLLAAVRAHRDSLRDAEHAQNGKWLPLTDDEVGELDLSELLGLYQVVADDEAISAYEDDLLRVLGGSASTPAGHEALAEYHARAGDLTAAAEHAPLTARLLSLAIPVVSGRELLDVAALLPDDERGQAYLDLAVAGPPEILDEVVALARSLDDLDIRGQILLWAADRTPDRADAVRLGREAWQLAVDTGVVTTDGGAGTSVLWARGRWLASAAVDVLLPLLPTAERTALLRRTLRAIQSLPDSHLDGKLRHVAIADDPRLRTAVLDQARGTDRLVALAVQGHHRRAVAGIRRLDPGYDRHEAITAVVAHLPPDWLPRVRELVDAENDQSGLEAIGAIARRLCVLGEPDEAVALLEELSTAAEFDQPSPREAAAAGLPALLLDLGQVARALEVLEFFSETNAWGDTPRLDALMAMLPDLVRVAPAQARQAVHALRGLRDRQRWLRLLTVYAHAVADGPPAELARLWDDSLRQAAAMDRARALAMVRALRPMTRALGGVEEEARSARLVHRWWP
jgi:hypothetical protein